MTGSTSSWALLLIALSSWACAPATSTPAKRQFHSTAYGYSIELPSGWSAVRANRGLTDGEAPVTGLPVTDIMAEHASRVFRQLSLPALVVGAQTVPSDENLQAWSGTVTGLVQRFKGCPAPAVTESITLGGRAALRLDYPNCPPSQHLYHLWTVAVIGGKGYQFVWFNTPGNEPKDRVLLDRMLSSVAFSR